MKVFQNREGGGFDTLFGILVRLGDGVSVGADVLKEACDPTRALVLLTVSNKNLQKRGSWSQVHYRNDGLPSAAQISPG